jgi:predicted acyl esterase
MRFCILIPAICFLVSLTPAQPARDTFWLTMDDSVQLDCTMFTPTDSPPPGGFPGIVFVHGLGQSKTACEPIADTFAVDGFVTLAYSVRGQGRSSGKSRLFSWRERRDLAAVVAWLAARPNVNDTLLGVQGLSQGGYHSWCAGIDRLPAVRAVAPENAVPHAEQSFTRYGCYNNTITNMWNYSSAVRIDTIAEPFKRLMLADDYDSVALLVEDGRSFDSTDVAASSAAYLMAGAWHDHAFYHMRFPGTFNVAPAHSIMYLGACWHNAEFPPKEYYFRDTLRRGFFAERLKGEYHGLDTIGPGVAALGPDWNHMRFQSWPPPGLTYIDYWLHSDSSASLQPPGAQDSLAHLELRRTDTAYVWYSAVVNRFQRASQAFQRNRVAFLTAPLTQPLALLGTPWADIWAKGPVPRKQITLQVYDQPDSGPPTYLTQISLGKRDNADSTHWDNLAGEFAPVGWVIPSGHRLRFDWAAINVTLTDTSLWWIPYWDADGWLTLGLDSLHPARISFPVLLSTGAQEGLKPQAPSHRPAASIVRGVLSLAGSASHKPQAAGLWDMTGRKVLDLKPGPNDVSRLAPGVYFVRRPPDITKVVVSK